MEEGAESVCPLSPHSYSYPLGPFSQGFHRLPIMTPDNRLTDELTHMTSFKTIVIETSLMVARAQGKRKEPTCDGVIPGMWKGGK